MHTRVVYYELILLAGSSMHTRLAVGFGTLKSIQSFESDQQKSRRRELYEYSPDTQEQDELVYTLN